MGRRLRCLFRHAASWPAAVVALLSVFFAAHVQCAVGVYNGGFQPSDGGRPPVIVSYRLNTTAEVRIEILDNTNSVISTLGPFASEGSGPHQHAWDGAGASASGLFKARITATAGPVGASPGDLVQLVGGWWNPPKYYGVAVDNNPNSPGYGNIYVPDCTAVEKPILAYYPDGAFRWQANTGFTASESPWGIGIDRQGYVYVAAKNDATFSGLKIFTSDGVEVVNLQPGIGQADNFFGGCLAGGLPYALKSNDTPELLSLALSADRTAALGPWTAMISPGVQDVRVFQFCFTPDAAACYLALHRKEYTDPNPANKGVQKWTGSFGGAWTQDANFDPGLASIPAGPFTAAEYATGVGLDSTGPGGSPRYLWIGVDQSNGNVGGCIKRLRLSDDALESFTGPGVRGRFVAPDGVGNVALDYDTDSAHKIDNKWCGWGLYAPYDQGSADQHTTAPAMVVIDGCSPPIIENASADPAIVARDGLDTSVLAIRIRDEDGEDDISDVRVDLSAIGGSSSTPVTQYVSIGDGLTREYSIGVTAAPGASVGLASLPITAHDGHGLTGNGAAELTVALCVDTIAAAKSWVDATAIAVWEPKVVSASFAECFYIVEDDRSCGIKVVSSFVPNVGQLVQVKGVLSTTEGERLLESALVR